MNDNYQIRNSLNQNILYKIIDKIVTINFYLLNRYVRGGAVDFRYKKSFKIQVGTCLPVLNNTLKLHIDGLLLLPD